MNNFNEQVVRRVNKPKNLIIKIVSVLLLILVPTTLFLLAFATIAYLIYVAFFVFVGGIYAVWYVFSIQKVDFEYSVSGNELEIAKVVALRKRKTMCKVQINEIERLEKETGGSPKTNLNQYYNLSPYSFSDTNQTAIKKLTNIPLRIYTEPDVDWWLKERNADLTNMNATECSAMINELNRLGNQSATLITTQNKLSPSSL